MIDIYLIFGLECNINAYNSFVLKGDRHDEFCFNQDVVCAWFNGAHVFSRSNHLSQQV